MVYISIIKSGNTSITCVSMLYFQILEYQRIELGNWRKTSSGWILDSCILFCDSQLYILWPQNGPVQGPKHVVTLNKDKNIR